MSDHQLALPLPPGYASDTCHELYSFFNSDSPSQYEVLDRYLDDLSGFLHKCRLIQCHPDSFLNLVRGEPCRRQSKYLHDQSMTSEEVTYTLGLCHSLAPILDREDCMTQMRLLLREGPPPLPLANDALFSFYATTRSLMLSRRRRPNNDAARVTLLPRRKNRENKTDHNTSSESAQRDKAGTITLGDSLAPVAGDSEKCMASAQRRQCIMEMVLSRGMCTKKRHEVAIMTDTVSDLVKCCGVGMDYESSNSTCSTDPIAVHTVINIGEGKGYVSRALALCDQLQVVGIDCNPLHKVGMPQRVEKLLEGCLSLQDGMCGRDIVNLMYEPRGHIASVVCRLESSGVRWDQLLHGHVLTAYDAKMHQSSSMQLQEPQCAEATKSESFDVSWDTEAASTEFFSQGLHQTTTKISCKVCGKIMRLGNVSAILKHINLHSNSKDEMFRSSLHRLRPGERSVGVISPDAQFPSIDTINRWNVEMPQSAFVARLTEAFFTRSSDSAHGPPTLIPHCSKDSTSVSLALDCVVDKERDTLSTEENMVLELLHLPRGMRAAVCVARQQRLEDAQWCYVEAIMTVIGYDDATRRHLVIFDDESKRESYTLLAFRSRDKHVGLERESQDEVPSRAIHTTLQIPEVQPCVWGIAKKALVRQKIPMLSSLKYILMVPSLRNAVIIGLHPCGDLGSNVCRTFAQSEARGLAVVSCCWHALTCDAFPLSRAMRRRNMTIDKISLLLATQPFDMWVTASPEGHHSSAKVLFFRSLLRMIWADWDFAWPTTKEASCCRDACQKSQGSSSSVLSSLESATAFSACAFAPIPHLEPSLLRRMAKIKDTLSFREFIDLVLREYIYIDTAKRTEYTIQNTVCANCRRHQECFLRASMGAAVETGKLYYQQYFGAFLGFTVLRMWMSHLTESLLLLDRTLYLHEYLSRDPTASGSSSVSLVPLFDGSISPRMYGILARRL